MERKIKMALIATYPKMAELFLQLTEKMDNVEVNSVYASFDEAVKIAKQMEKENEVDVILSRGGTAAQVKEAVNVPVVTIPITPFDVVQIVHQIKDNAKDIAFIHYDKNVCGVQDIAKMYELRIEEYSFISYTDIENAVKDIYKQGICHVIGGEVAVRIAHNYGMNGYQVSAGKEAVERAVNEAIFLLYEKRKEQNRAMQLKAAYDSLREGMIVTDENKRIVMINKVAGNLYKNRYKAGDLVGADIMDEKYMQAYKRKTEIAAYLRKFQRTICSVVHIPIIKNGNFIGLVSRMEDVTATQKLEQKIREELHQKGFVAKYHFEDIITEDPEMLKVLKRAKVYACMDSAVLIEGESGTGKELLAQSIHNESGRRNSPFVAVNCAAIPENLLESELFGYEAGAFTGAKKEGKAGLFELAHNGTLFLDEIGEISKSVQTRLLRVLQEKEIMHVGGSRIIPINVRIISATNQSLQQEAEKGKFREDLYYRLNVLSLKIPPLRQRPKDIEVLSGYYLQKYHKNTNKLQDIGSMLRTYKWPGNIRELQSVMERYGVLLEVLGDSILDENLGEVLGISRQQENAEMERDVISVRAKGTLHEMVEKFEYKVIDKYLSEYQNNQEAAAKALGIGRTTLWRKYKEI